MFLIFSGNAFSPTQPFEDYPLYSNRSVLRTQIGNDAFHNLSRCNSLLQSAEIQRIDQRIRQLFLLQEHEHVDRKIGDFVYLLDVAAAENVSFFDAVIRLLQYVVHGVVSVIILAGFDFDGQDLPACLDHKIQLSELLAVVILECKSVGSQLLGGDILINRTEIDGRFMLQYLDLNLASILRSQQADVVGKELEQILGFG